MILGLKTVPVNEATQAIQMTGLANFRRIIQILIKFIPITSVIHREINYSIFSMDQIIRCILQ